jgi:hypothetical protein
MSSKCETLTVIDPLSVPKLAEGAIDSISRARRLPSSDGGSKSFSRCCVEEGPNLRGLAEGQNSCPPFDDRSREARSEWGSARAGVGLPLAPARAGGSDRDRFAWMCAFIAEIGSCNGGPDVNGTKVNADSSRMGLSDQWAYMVRLCDFIDIPSLYKAVGGK